MKIFFDHKIFVNQIYGGPSRYFINLVNELNNLEQTRAKIFAPLHINNYIKNLDKKNIGFANKIIFQEKFFNSPRLKKKLMNINNHLNKYFLNRFKPDIIHTTYFDKKNFKSKNKIVVTVFDLIHEIFRKEYCYPDKYFPKKEMLDIADHIICISNSTKKDLMEYYNIPDDKISVIYLATDFTLTKNQSPLRDRYILYVGTRWKYKNFSALLEVMAKGRNILQKYKLVTFGGGEFSREEIDQIDKFNFDKTNILQLHGDDNLLKTLYRNAEFFIYPTKYEGFGIPLLESFSQKCPVLCSNISSLKEVAGDAATYFDPNNTQSILDGIKKITSNTEYKNKSIEKGLIKLKEFSWKRCALETLNVYKKLI